MSIDDKLVQSIKPPIENVKYPITVKLIIVSVTNRTLTTSTLRKK